MKKLLIIITLSLIMVFAAAGIAVASDTRPDTRPDITYIIRFEGTYMKGSPVRNGDTISITLPYGTDVSALVATYSVINTTGIMVGDTPQDIGRTPNDFTGPVVFTLFNDRTGEKRNITVKVAVAKPKIIDASYNKSYFFSVIGNQIIWTLPRGYDPQNLKLYFHTDPQNFPIYINGREIIPGETAVDVTKPVDLILGNGENSYSLKIFGLDGTGGTTGTGGTVDQGSLGSPSNRIDPEAYTRWMDENAFATNTDGTFERSWADVASANKQAAIANNAFSIDSSYKPSENKEEKPAENKQEPVKKLNLNDPGGINADAVITILLCILILTLWAVGLMNYVKYGKVISPMYKVNLLVLLGKILVLANKNKYLARFIDKINSNKHLSKISKMIADKIEEAKAVKYVKKVTTQTVENATS